MAATARSSRLFMIPAGTRPSVCNGPRCGREIFWILNPTTGRMMPIDVNCPNGQRPSEHVKDPSQQSLFGDAIDHHDGFGVPHTPGCPDREMFRGPRG